mgnify:CR=1 FL=1
MVSYFYMKKLKRKTNLTTFITIVSILALFSPLLFGAAIGAIIAFVILLCALIYLYKTDKRLEKKALLVIMIGILIAAGLVINIRLLSGEDDWICKNCSQN